MRERVSVRLGIKNVILICPHGHILDDTNTDIITQTAADYLDCCAVINNGWRRSDKVDALKSSANCNNINHCNEPVVKEEFLNPIDDYFANFYDDFDDEVIHAFVIHGVGNSIRGKAKDLDIIIGYGTGNQPRYTCDLWRKDLLAELFFNNTLNVYEGAPGGKYSARNKENLTQALVKEYAIQTMQIEFIYDLRKDEKTARNLGKLFGITIENYLKCDGFSAQRELPQI